MLGREISVRSTADEGTVRKVESFVNKRLEQVLNSGNTVDSQVAVILTLLNVAEDYLAVLDRLENSRKDEDFRIAGLIQRLDSAK
ncbi:cell division protein ZapA [Geotalea toluenoxydans]|uniref:cell division protein ZapA n=1 Tax=Geotalea toluenoxydans TaxID=421624 RepID=UPI0034E2A6CB